MPGRSLAAPPGTAIVFFRRLLRRCRQGKGRRTVGILLRSGGWRNGWVSGRAVLLDGVFAPGAGFRGGLPAVCPAVRVAGGPARGGLHSVRLAGGLGQWTPGLQRHRLPRGFAPSPVTPSARPRPRPHRLQPASPQLADAEPPAARRSGTQPALPAPPARTSAPRYRTYDAATVRAVLAFRSAIRVQVNRAIQQT